MKMTTGRTSQHVAVIGGGVTGAVTSVMLAEAGFSVTVIEKAYIGNGSSSRSAAAQRCQFGTKETCIGMMWSQDYYDCFHTTMKSTQDEATEGPVIVHNGYLWLYEDPLYVEDVRRESATQAWETALKNATMQKLEVGLPIEILTPSDVHSRWPHIMRENLVGATFCGRDGFLRHDRIYTIAFRRARDLGVDILLNTDVVGAITVHERNRSGAMDSRSPDRIAALKTRCAKTGEETVIDIDAVVNATNAWAPRTSRLLGGMELPISPVKRYLYFQRRPPGLCSDEVWNALPFTIYGMGSGRGAYSRPENNNQMMYGWAHSTPPEPGFADEDQDLIQPGFKHTDGESYGI